MFSTNVILEIVWFPKKIAHKYRLGSAYACQPTHASLRMPRRLTWTDTSVDFLFQESFIYTFFILKRNVSARISHRSLIRVDTLRRVHHFGLSWNGLYVYQVERNTVFVVAISECPNQPVHRTSLLDVIQSVLLGSSSLLSPNAFCEHVQIEQPPA